MTFGLLAEWMNSRASNDFDVSPNRVQFQQNVQKPLVLTPFNCQWKVSGNDVRRVLCSACSWVGSSHSPVAVRNKELWECVCGGLWSLVKVCVRVCEYLQFAFMVSAAERVEGNFEGFPHRIEIIHDGLRETNTEQGQV